MSRWFRSEPMEYVSIIVNEDAAHDCLADLGTLGVIQFTDLNPDLTPFQRRYVSFIKRCDELERTLRFFSSECDKFELILESAGDVTDFLMSSSGIDPNDNTGSRLLEAMEVELCQYESQLKELNSYSEKLTVEYNEKVELQEVLEKARQFFMTDQPYRNLEYRSSNKKNDKTASLLKIANEEDEDEDEFANLTGNNRLDMDMRFSSITGVVSMAEKARFERMIFRATRGNCYVRFAPVLQPITDPQSGLLLEKCVFIIFYKSLSIETKLKKICDAFSAHRYSLPDMDDADAIEHMLTENAQELVDSRTVLLKNQDTRFGLCRMLSEHTERWTWIVMREKASYHSLNMFNAVSTGMLRGEGWVIADQLGAVTDSINMAHANMDMAMPSLIQKVPKPWPTPPTHFKTNKFTDSYQEFVNTYGIPRYREANPALFTAATFPFMFGVMYGDIGHGSFIFAAGLYLLYNEKANDNKKLPELAQGLHSGRYMLTMMGFFAVYAGFVYNDCFSLGLNLFGSRYVFDGQDDLNVKENQQATTMYTYGDPQQVYPFGLDPVWHISTNELLFFNSFKMKLSVILGIIQMFMGTLLKGLNAVYFEERLDLLFEVLPMLAFASSLFVYMVFLIFLKWSIPWDSRMLSATCVKTSDDAWGSDNVYKEPWVTCTDAGYGCTPWGYTCTGTDTTVDKCPLNYGGSGDGCQPPNLITSLINIALKPFDVDEPLYNHQQQVQVVLLLIALVSVPTLLLVKPWILSSQQHPTVYSADDDQDDEEGLQQSHTNEENDEEEHSFGDLLIHQAIETIEFVLGMVSNTASYLRLWALSLAHSELATVFWEKAMLSTLSKNWFFTYLGFAVFAGTTGGVLLLMDVLECFLHALRLHWVEFQNKFFKADGVRFAPYSFRQVIEESAM